MPLHLENLITWQQQPLKRKFYDFFAGNIISPGTGNIISPGAVCYYTRQHISIKLKMQFIFQPLYLQITQCQTDVAQLPKKFFVFSSCLAWFACVIYFSAAEFVKCSTFDSNMISLIFGIKSLTDRWLHIFYVSACKKPFPDLYLFIFEHNLENKQLFRSWSREI